MKLPRIPPVSVWPTIGARAIEFSSNQRPSSISTALAACNTVSSSATCSESTYFAGDTPGFFGILHTWGRNLCYHPHIHYIVPAGAFDRQTRRWYDCPNAFYAPVRILSKLVKTRFFALTEKTGLLDQLPPGAFEKDWNVDSRPVGSGVRAALSLCLCLSHRDLRQAHRERRRGLARLCLYRYQDRSGRAHEPQAVRVHSAFPSPSLKRQRTFTRTFIANTPSPRPALPSVPVVVPRGTFSSSHRLPLVFIPGSSSVRRSTHELSART